MPKKLYILSIFVLINLFTACNYTRHIPEDKQILWDNEIILDGDESAPSEAYSILKQRPVVHYWLMAPNLAIYNWGNGSDSSIFSKIGDAPVIFNAKKAERGSEQLQNFFFNKGYFQASSKFEINEGKRSKWVEAKYFVDRGNRYYIRNFTTKFQNNRLEKLYLKEQKNSLIKEGQPYDASVLDKERDRLTDLFKNNGFYSFSKSFIYFDADTFAIGDSVNITLNISRIAKKRGDSIYYEDHEFFRIGEVFIQPDFSFRSKENPKDTLPFEGYKITFDTLNYKPRYLTDAVHFKKGDLFQEKKIKDSYSHFNSYAAFKITEINFKLAGRDSLGPILHSFVKLRPEDGKALRVETEATSTSGNYGINLKVGWRSRNIFGGGEELDVKLNGGIEFQTGLTDDGRSQTYEIGGEMGIKFPRFLLPFNTIGLLPKRMKPSSRISIYGNRVLRNEFDRETFGGRLNYNWSESSTKTHSLDLADISYSRFFEKNFAFFGSLDDFQQSVFTPALISATRFTYTYNQQKKKGKKNHHFFKGNIELAGNILSLIESNTGSPVEDSTGVNLIGTVPYFQYVKLESDYRYYWNFTKKTSWVNRAYAATIRPYGNSISRYADGSEDRNAPFSKFFFIGGSNDLRAWPAYRLGAGTQENTFYNGDGNNDSNFAVGTIKLMLNSELRFPLFSFFEGAIFVDAGNIWLNGGLENEETDFKVEDILEQFAIGAGLGIRMDFDFFIIRFDVGAKIRDPGRISIDDPWVYDNQPLTNLTYNIALGYPF